ncbi:transglycosylase domain-containing protein [Chryseolinea sp. T2]|uniref:transglycosylase domain-containing protein n=1 Tax=Chryseolinea sp. T2 TaxID=3129255 RepID=UPI0030773645
MNISNERSHNAQNQDKTSILLRRNIWFKRGVRAIWIGFICIVFGLPMYVLAVSNDLFGIFGGLPSTKSIENPENDLSSDIISADGVSLGRYYRYNRSQVSYDQLSPDLINTLIHSEDHRFYEHSGLDFYSYIRVLYGIFTFRAGVKGGGSTISQQVAKNLFDTRGEELSGSVKFPGPLHVLVSKTKEWIIAIQLERNLTKEEIIAMYFNTVPFGRTTYGIKVAAETYFNKEPHELTLSEAAVLVGMLQGNYTFNPIDNPENASRKRNQVLAKLFDYGYIKSEAKYDSLISSPIKTKYRLRNQNAGLATYFRAVIKTDLLKWARLRNIDLEESGLRIYTTIDSRMQRYAEEAVFESMKQQQVTFNSHLNGRKPWIDENGNEIQGFLQTKVKKTDAYRHLVARYGEKNDSVKIMLNKKKRMWVFTYTGERDTLFSTMDSLNYYLRFLQSGFMSMDPLTGAVKAWVGGVNYKYFKYDHVKQGKRQPGSTFKPFVYGRAIEDGYSPCLTLLDISPTFKLSNGDTWTPSNSDGTRGDGQPNTLRRAMARSLNTITAQVMQKVGIENVVDFAYRMGITSKLDPVPSLCLGVSDISLYELVAAYSAYVNSGIHTQPFYITRIEDKNGNVLENFTPKIRQAVSEQTAFKMVYMLMGGVEEEGGSSRALPEDLKSENEIGGKTGTTTNASDGWYMGITHNLVSGAWVGGDERSIHYRTWSLGQGGNTARPIWARYMQRVYADRSLEYKKGAFKRPEDGLDASLDCSAYVNPDTPDSDPDDNASNPNY